MKKIIIFSLFLITCLLVSQAFCAVNLEQAEYYIDSDPGFGNGAQISIGTPSPELSLDFNIDLSALANGFHTLYIRAKDADGNWSLSQNRSFFKLERSALDALPNIVKAEYYLDNDPGFDSGVDVPFSAGNTIAKDFGINLSSVSSGFHVLYFRVKDALGQWSTAYSRPFFKTDETIVQMEYFLDADPGKGNGVNVPINAATGIDRDFFVPLIGVNNGGHTLYVRVKDKNGLWSGLSAVNFSAVPMTLMDAILVLHALVEIPLPNGWNISYEGLANIVPDGKLDMKDAIRIITYLSGS